MSPDTIVDIIFGILCEIKSIIIWGLLIMFAINDLSKFFRSGGMERIRENRLTDGDWKVLRYYVVLSVGFLLVFLVFIYRNGNIHVETTFF